MYKDFNNNVTNIVQMLWWEGNLMVSFVSSSLRRSQACMHGDFMFRYAGPNLRKRGYTDHD